MDTTDKPRGGKDPPRPRTSPYADMTPDRLVFLLTCEIYYYDARARFFWLCDKVCSILIIFGGAYGVLSNVSREVNMTAAFVVTLAGALQVVFNYSDRRAEHVALKERYNRILARVVVKQNAGDNPAAWFPKLYAQYSAQLFRKTSHMNMVEALAWNRAMRQLYDDVTDDELMYVPFWCKRTRHMFSGDHVHLKTKARVDREAAERRAKGWFGWWRR